MRKKSPKRKISYLSPLTVGACVGTALFATGSTAFAQAETGNTVRMERLEKENADLKKRLDMLEGMAQKEGLISSTGAKPLVKALSEIQLSGFVTASYFYDTSTPKDGKANGYLWNTSENSFSINKVKLTLASKPIEKDKWDAAFRASMIWGEDAPVVNTGNYSQTVTNSAGQLVRVRDHSSTGFDTLREAYVELNIPIGTGLDIKAGQLISLLNYESGDGGAVNANFSQGYQWYYTGNGPSAGVQLGYAFNDMVDFKVRVQNGLYAGAIDNNDSKCVMAAIGLKPMKDLWFSVIGFESHENTAFTVQGASLLAGYQVSKPFGLGFEFDYFNFELDPKSGTFGNHSDLWSAGIWLGYDFSPKVGVALRAEYLDDGDGFGIPGLGVGGRSGSAITTPDSDGNLASVTFTINYKPVPNIKIQPEIRWDHTTYKAGFDGVENRVLFGAGVSYLF
jgi:hypothetical protein